MTPEELGQKILDGVASNHTVDHPHNAVTFDVDVRMPDGRLVAMEVTIKRKQNP